VPYKGLVDDLIVNKG